MLINVIVLGVRVTFFKVDSVLTVDLTSKYNFHNIISNIFSGKADVHSAFNFQNFCVCFLIQLMSSPQWSKKTLACKRRKLLGRQKDILRLQAVE